MNEENNTAVVKKWFIIVGVVIVSLACIVLLFLRFGKNTPIATIIGGVLPFGDVATDTTSGEFTGTNGGMNSGIETSGGTTEEPLFRQLSDREIAGATVITRGGQTLVRYILRENGNVYEIDTATWKARQLTNTTIPRVYEAFFANNGNSVILRYLNEETIKTYLGEIVLPVNMETVPDSLGEIHGKYLPDNIIAVSVSPNSSHFFYLLKSESGSMGFTQQASLKAEASEVFKSSFTEWLPELHNDGKILLTTKASASVPGFAYLYDPKDKAMTRTLREKNALTTHGSTGNGLILFGENIGGVSTLGVYDALSISSEEGVPIYEASIPLTSLPEKCAWTQKGEVLYCAAFSNSEKKDIPDAWYQGYLSFNDTFWLVHPRTGAIAQLASPEREIGKQFDVINPFVDSDERALFFTDKNTSHLWSMKIIAPRDTDGVENSGAPKPRPEEAKDAAGSTIDKSN